MPAQSGNGSTALSDRAHPSSCPAGCGKPRRLNQTSPRRHGQVFLCPSPDRASRKKRVTWDWAGGGPVDPLPASPSQQNQEAGPLSATLGSMQAPPACPPRGGDAAQHPHAAADLVARDLSRRMAPIDDSSLTESTYDESSSSMSHLAQRDDSRDEHAAQVGVGQQGPARQQQSGNRVDPTRSGLRDSCGCGPECWCRHPLQTDSPCMGWATVIQTGAVAAQCLLYMPELDLAVCTILRDGQNAELGQLLGHE